MLVQCPQQTRKSDTMNAFRAKNTTLYTFCYLKKPKDREQITKKIRGYFLTNPAKAFSELNY